MDDRSNSTCCSQYDEVYASYSYKQLAAAICAIISIIGTTSNLLVVVAVILSKKLQHTTNIFVLNLSIADLLTCTYYIPVSITAMLSDSPTLRDVPCKVASFQFFLCLGCSINTLAFIAINRYALITRSKVSYRKLFSRQRTLMAIITTWTAPMCIILLPVLTGYIRLGFEAKNSSCSWVLLDSSANFSIVLFVTFLPVQVFAIFWSYLRVFQHVRSHTKRVQQRINRVKVAVVMKVPTHKAFVRRPKRNKLQIEVTKNLFYVVCLFVLCVVPYNLSLVLDQKGKFAIISGIILFSNTCVNPIIYAAMHPHFRTVFRCIIQGKFSQIPERLSCRRVK